jgi:fructuronate reductase
MLGCRDVFSPELASNEGFRNALIEAVTQLNGGARAAIENTNLKDVWIKSASRQNL